MKKILAKCLLLATIVLLAGGPDDNLLKDGGDNIIDMTSYEELFENIEK